MSGVRVPPPASQNPAVARFRGVVPVRLACNCVPTVFQNGARSAPIRPSGHVYRHEGRRGPVWRALYRLPDGRRVHKTIGPAWTERGRPATGHFTRRFTEDWLRHALAEARRGTLPGISSTRAEAVGIGGAAAANVSRSRSRPVGGGYRAASSAPRRNPESPNHEAQKPGRVAGDTEVTQRLDQHLDADRLSRLVMIGVDEIGYRRQRYLTQVCDQHTARSSRRDRAATRHAAGVLRRARRAARVDPGDLDRHERRL